MKLPPTPVAPLPLGPTTKHAEGRAREAEQGARIDELEQQQCAPEPAAPQQDALETLKELAAHPEHAVDPLLGSADGSLILAALVDAAAEHAPVAA